MTDTVDTVETIDTAETVDVAAPTKKRKEVVRRDEFQLKELVNEYIKSGLTIMEFCKEHKEAPPTLVKHLEDAGYRMTLGTAQGCDELQAENERLINSIGELLKKYEPDKHKTAILACID